LPTKAIVAAVKNLLLPIGFSLLAVAIALFGRVDLRLALPDAAALATHVQSGAGAGDAAFPKLLVDPVGGVTILPRPPQRIASATLASDEILLELVGPGSLVGVTRFVDDPHLSLDAGTAPPAIARIEARAERLLPLVPDLAVVANFTRAETVHLAHAAGVPLLRLGAFTSFDDVFKNIRRLAAATATEAKAEAWIETLHERILRVERRSAGRTPPRVLYLAGGTYTAGRGSLVDEILTRAGAHNCVRDIGLSGSVPIAIELAIALQPEIVLITGWNPAHGRTIAENLRKDPRWRGVPAVRDDRVFVMHSALLLSVTHHVVDAVEEVHRTVYAPARRRASGGTG
jgi:iron complex transport system substrate-binding protein